MLLKNQHRTTNNAESLIFSELYNILVLHCIIKSLQNEFRLDSQMKFNKHSSEQWKMVHNSIAQRWKIKFI